MCNPSDKPTNQPTNQPTNKPKRRGWGNFTFMIISVSGKHQQILTSCKLELANVWQFCLNIDSNDYNYDYADSFFCQSTLCNK